MKESIWGYAIITLGILAVGIIWFFANTTKTDQHNYYLIKETVEAAMYDALDLSAYREDGTIRIKEEKFVESFIRRFAANADLSNEYQIDIYDISETPPKVSLRVGSISETTATGEVISFNMINNIDAILETKYTETTITYIAFPGSATRTIGGEETEGKGHYCQVLITPEGKSKLVSIKNISTYVNETDIDYYNDNQMYKGYVTSDGTFTMFSKLEDWKQDKEDVLKPIITDFEVRYTQLPEIAEGDTSFSYEGKTYMLVKKYEGTTVTNKVEKTSGGINQIYFDAEVDGKSKRYYYACFDVIGNCTQNGASKCYYPFRYDVVWE